MSVYGEEVAYVNFHDPSGWAAEESWGKGNLCYAAVTVAVQSALRNKNLTQTEVAHNDCLKNNQLMLFENRPDLIKQYAQVFNLAPGDQAIPYASVDQSVVDDFKSILGQVWGAPDLEGLNIAMSATADDDAICKTIENKGLVAMGNPQHYWIACGYTLYGSGARKFKVWNPADGKAVDVEAGDLDYYEQFLHLT